MLVDKIVLSTDNERIAQVALSFGFSKVEIFNRSAASATDTASTESAMLEYIEAEQPTSDDTFMLVQATSPFTTTEHFTEALQVFGSSAKDSLLSVSRSKRFFWDPDGSPLNYDYRARPRRQDFDGLLMENGAFYISTVKAITESKNRLSGQIALYEMPEYTGLELDELDDWIVGEQLMKANL